MFLVIQPIFWIKINVCIKVALKKNVLSKFYAKNRCCCKKNFNCIAPVQTKRFQILKLTHYVYEYNPIILKKFLFCLLRSSVCNILCYHSSRTLCIQISETDFFHEIGFCFNNILFMQRVIFIWHALYYILNFTADILNVACVLRLSSNLGI